MVKALLDAGAGVNAINSSGDDPHKLAKDAHRRDVHELLSRGRAGTPVGADAAAADDSTPSYRH